MPLAFLPRLPFLVLLYLSALQSEAVSANPSGCVTSFDVNAGYDYFPTKIGQSNASTFTVTYHNYYKILTTSTEKIVLWQCGTQQPVVTGADAYVSIPITRIAVGSTTMIPFVQVLGESESIVGTPVVSTVSSPCLLARISAGDAISILTSSWSLNQTAVDTSQAEIYIGYSATMPAITNYEYLEKYQLGIVSYVHFMATFYNKEAVSNSVYMEISNRLDCIDEAVNTPQISNAMASTNKVLWCSAHYLGSGWSCGVCPNYYCDAVRKAGGVFLEYTEVLGIAETTSALTDEQFLSLAAQADIWIYTSFDYDTKYIAHQSILDTLPCVQSRNVFGLHGKGSTDWFESRVLEQDVLVEDVLAALAVANPDLSVSHDPVWIVPMYLSQNEIDNPSNYGRGSCINSSAPLALQANLCEDLQISTTVAAGASDKNDDNLIIGISAALASVCTFLLVMQIYTCKRMKDENVAFLSLATHDVDSPLQEGNRGFSPKNGSVVPLDEEREPESTNGNALIVL